MTQHMHTPTLSRKQTSASEAGRGRASASEQVSPWSLQSTPEQFTDAWIEMNGRW